MKAIPILFSRACNFGYSSRVTDVTFRFAAFVVMIRLNRWSEMRSGKWIGEESED
jgi:hypothetical protein